MDFCPLTRGECYGRECGCWAETEHARGCALRVLAEALATLAHTLSARESKEIWAEIIKKEAEK